MVFGHYAFQVDDILVVELAHDARLRQEVQASLFRCALFERLDRHGYVFEQMRLVQFAAADISEFAYDRHNKDDDDDDDDSDTSNLLQEMMYSMILLFVLLALHFRDDL